MFCCSSVCSVRSGGRSGGGRSGGGRSGGSLPKWWTYTYADACWFPTIGPEANSNATAAMAIVLNAIVVFEFIVSISTFFNYMYNVVYSTNALQLLLTSLASSTV